jgi:predicted dehydrogenase
LAKTLGVGMIGVGSIADLHAEGYRKNSSAKIVGVTDVAQDLANAKAEKYGAGKVYESVEKMLADPMVEAVDIAVPTVAHMPLAIKACEAGKHVMLEKPMARTTEECDRIIKAADAAGVKLMVDHSLRFFPPFRQAKKLVDEGGIGQLVKTRATHMGWGYMGWRADPEQAGGGLLIEGAVHPLYLSEWFLGKIKRVSAITGKTSLTTMPTEDVAMMVLEGSGEAFGVIDANLNGPFPLWDDHLEIVGNSGMIIANGAEQQIIRGPPIWHFKDGMWQAYREKTFGDEFPFQVPNEIEWSWPKCFAYATAEFVSSVLEERAPLTTGRDGRRAIQLVQACYESAKNGRVVDTP